jgi:GntR family transcriptional regulator
MAEIPLKRLSPRDERPLYSQIMSILEQEITTGRLRPGDQLPTQEALAGHFGVSLAPVKQALRELEDRGVISTLQGRGTYVLDATPLSEEIIDANRIPNFSRDMAEAGRNATSAVLDAGVVAAREYPEAMVQLGLARGSRLVRMERLRLADGEPLCLQTSFFPEALVPGLVERGLEPTESLTDVLQAEMGIVVAVSRQTISATAATAFDAEHLMVELGAPLLLVERTSYLGTKDPVEFVRDRRVTGFPFVVWLRRQ